MNSFPNVGKCWPLGSFGGERERRAVVKKDIPSLCGWKKGRIVFAEPGCTPGEYNIRPENCLGPTTVCVPGDIYLRFDEAAMEASA